MSLRNPRLNPDAIAELAALDMALRGHPVGPEHVDLVGLLADVRETAPEPTPAFLAGLEEQVRQGFPLSHDGAPPAPAPARRRPARWLLTGAGGLVATVAVAAVVMVSAAHDDATNATGVAAGPSPRGEAPSTAGRSARSAEAGSAAQAAPNAAPSTAVDGAASGADSAVAPSPGDAVTSAPPLSEDVALGATRRRVQRSAALDLTVAPKAVQETADEVVRATDRFGGIVQSSSVSVGAETSGQALLVVRVPSARMGGALAAYSRLGNVARRTQDAEDVTAAVVSTQERLADARAERRGLLRALGRAETPQAIESLRARVRLNRSELARIGGELRAMRTRVDLATLTVTIAGREDTTTVAEDGQWSIGDAARDAGRLLEVGAGVVLLALTILIPAGLLVAGGVAAGRIVRQRRRQATLDAA